MRVIRHPEVPQELEATALWYVGGSEQSFSTNQDRVGLENPGGVDWLEPLVGSAGEFGRERQFAVYHGLGNPRPPAPPLDVAPQSAGSSQVRRKSAPTSSLAPRRGW
jgi:hypothetical protein